MTSNSRARSSSLHETASRSLEIVGLFSDLLGVGGVQEAGRLTAAALDRIAEDRGTAAEFLSLNDAPASQAFHLDERRVAIDGFERKKIQYTLHALRHARRASRDIPTVVIAAHPHLAVPAALIKQITPRVKVLVMSHGIEVWTALSPARKRAVFYADRVCAPSRYTAEKLVEVQGIANNKVRVLPWPLSPEIARFVSDAAALPLPPDFPPGRVVLTVGRWSASERYKGADDLIRAIAQLKSKFPDLQLVAVGDGDDLSRLSELAQSLRVLDRVHFLSGLTRVQIAACYSRAEIFALPSSGEGFGLVFLEAMAFAKPLVGAAVGGPLDLIQHGANGILVPPSDPQKLAGALAELLNDESLCSRMGRSGAERARTTYSFRGFTERLEQILDECVSSLS